MVSFYDVNFHAWIIKGDSMGARFYSDHGLGCAITFPCNAALEQQRWQCHGNSDSSAVRRRLASSDETDIV